MEKKSYLRISGFSHSFSFCLFIFVIYQINVSANPSKEVKCLIWTFCHFLIPRKSRRNGGIYFNWHWLETTKARDKAVFSYVTNTLVFLVYKDHSGKCQGNCMIVPWLLRLPRCQRANGVHLTSLQAACFPSHVSTLSILLCYHPPATPSKTCVLWSRSWGPHTLFNHSIGRQAGALLGHPAAGRGASFSLSSCPTPQHCWTHWAAPTNQTVRYSHTALITAVCRNEKDRLNQSDLAGNHGMLFKVNVFVIYKKFPAWSFVWEKKKSYDRPPPLLPKGKTNAKNVP